MVAVDVTVTVGEGVGKGVPVGSGCGVFVAIEFTGVFVTRFGASIGSTWVGVAWQAAARNTIMMTRMLFQYRILLRY
jgi:hypothetical protein